MSVLNKYFNDQVNGGRKSSVTPTMATPSPEGCELTVSYIYPRTSSNKLALGFKPTTTCNRTVPEVRHYNNIERQEIFSLWFSKYSHNEYRYGLAKWTELDIAMSCVNQNSGWNWRGTTLGEVESHDGNWYVARVYTPEQWWACNI